MFREDEKEERGVLVMLGLLIAAIVASIFGFAIYQSGVLKSFVGNDHVIGKAKVDLPVVEGTAAAALVNELQHKDVVAYDHSADKAHMQAYGEHSHGTDFVASHGSHLSAEDLSAQHLSKYHSTVTYDHSADAAHMAAYGTHSHGTAFTAEGDAGLSADALKAQHMDAYHQPKSFFELKDDSGAAFILDNGVAKFYFATGKTQVIDGALAQLGDIVAELKQGDKKAVLSGFVDPRGSAEMNAELAKNRAIAVRDLLVSQGVALESIELRKPSDIVPEGTDYSELRRVELTLEAK